MVIKLILHFVLYVMKKQTIILVGVVQHVNQVCGTGKDSTGGELRISMDYPRMIGFGC
jgi:hypothetical protein